LQVFPTKFVARSVLYKIFCKKNGSNFLQKNFFTTKFISIFYEKIFKTKLTENTSFFSSDHHVNRNPFGFSFSKLSNNKVSKSKTEDFSTSTLFHCLK